MFYKHFAPQFVTNNLFKSFLCINKINISSIKCYIHFGALCIYFAARFLLLKLKNKIKMKFFRSLQIAVMTIFYLMSATLLFKTYEKNNGIKTSSEEQDATEKH